MKIFARVLQDFYFDLVLLRPNLNLIASPLVQLTHQLLTAHSRPAFCLCIEHHLPLVPPAHHRSRKLRIICFPPSVRTLSGWNCTPSMGRVRWRSPIMTEPPAFPAPLASGVRAVIVSSSGRDSSAIINEW